jgi:type III restriction enzyme
VQLTRKTVADILVGIDPVIFEQFKKNPEHFISEASRLIHEQKARLIIEHLAYDPVAASIKN